MVFGNSNSTEIIRFIHRSKDFLQVEAISNGVRYCLSKFPFITGFAQFTVSLLLVQFLLDFCFTTFTT